MPSGSLHRVTHPTVSILLPARDAEATVEAAVKSLLVQTFADFELLAVDDGSKDGTRAVLQRLATGEPRLRVFSTPGAGLVGALAMAMTAARGRYVARMDADDESLPKRLERSVAALEADPALAGVGTGVEIFREDRPPSPNLLAYGAWLSSLTTPERLFHERLVESPLCHPSVTLKRSALEAVGGWRDGDFPEDWELWLRLLEAGHRLVCLPEVLHRWRDSESRLTRKDARYGLDRHLALKAEAIARRFQKVSLTFWGAGEVGLKLSRLVRAKGVAVVRFVELHPRKVGRRLEGVPVIRPEELGPPGVGHLLAAVGAKGARAQIRAWLVERKWTEGVDFTCVA